ncbi:pyrroline-5-carboxylate reductase [Oricola cellulosilytica]|uniref:Pyrroline-5-carboxylate reductase n=1 Tax=Oricola cellulosilytica TaxID=1429082 RepID=A0A4R0PFF4_9HYPH|nr:pyrroline-5-carboxylate reductase [Oricola cellulosilytica]TCD16566.1 pyrroline-5-carboxylate reductase [Oricola cellulosilytica]
MTGKNTVILAGCGNMGFAMLKGWLASGALQAGDVYVVEPSEQLRSRAGELGVNVAAGASDLPHELNPALVILAVKPQAVDAVLPDYARFADAGSTVVSVAAGITIARFEEKLGANAAIIRVMPNTPAAVGAGMMVLCANSRVGEASMEFARTLMAASGDVAVIDDESLMDAVTAVSGSGPAYLFHMIEALTEAARTAGLPDEIAAQLARQTIYGAAVYAHESGVEPGTLREQVTSPQGTTEAALSVLMKDGRLTKLMTEAVEAARKRSVELGK